MTDKTDQDSQRNWLIDCLKVFLLVTLYRALEGLLSKSFPGTAAETAPAILTFLLAYGLARPRDRKPRKFIVLCFVLVLFELIATRLFGHRP